jgi:hypothetical protein
MGQDRQHTEQFTDEESALRRHARFGQLPARVLPNDQLPARVLPNDLIETKETDPPHEEPQEPMYRGEWGPGYLERQLAEPRAGRETGRDVPEERVREVGRRERGEILDRLVDEAGVSHAWWRTTGVIARMLVVLAVVGGAVFVAGLVVSGEGLVWIGLALSLGSFVLLRAMVAARWQKIANVRWQEGAVTFRTVKPGRFDADWGQRVDCEVELSPHERIAWVLTWVDVRDARRLVVGATMRCLIDRMEYSVLLRAFPNADPNHPLSAQRWWPPTPSGPAHELRFRKNKA